MLFQLFSVSIGLSPAGWLTAGFSGLAFIVMFGIVSVKGDYKGVIESSLAKPLDKEKGLRR